MMRLKVNAPRLSPPFAIPDQGQHFLQLKIDDEFRPFGLIFFWRQTASGHLLQQFRVVVFTEFFQEQSDAPISRPPFPEQIDRIRILLQILVGQPLPHDHGDGAIGHDVGACINGGIDPALPVRRR